MTTIPADAAAIRKRLNAIAPLKPQGRAVTADSLGRYLAMEAQLAWSRSAGSIDHPVTMQDIAIVTGYFAAAHALLRLHDTAPQEADEVAEEIAGALEDPGDIGSWLWEHHGSRAQEVADLAAALAKATAPRTGQP